MNTQLGRIPLSVRHKPIFPARPDRRSRTQSRARPEETAQLIYAHLPPAAVLATEQHLRAQTQIEQRAQQRWYARGGCSGGALGDWLRAEREVVQNLCDALLRRNLWKPESAAAGH